MEYLELLKKNEAYRAVIKDFNSDGAAHAYLILSADRKLAEEIGLIIAMAAVCESSVKPCMHCRACKNVAAHVHPDVRFLPESGEVLKTEDVTALVSDCYIRGMESRNKVYVIRNASEILPVAQNKLLKTVEEPPEGVTIVFLADNDAKILNTIQSRVRRVEIEPFSVEDVTAFLTAKYGDEQRARVMAVCSDGLPGRAEEMFRNPAFFEMYEDMFRVFAGFDSSAKLPEKSLILVKYKDQAEEMLHFMQLVLRDALMLKTQPGLVRASHKLRELKEIAALYPQAALIAAIVETNSAKDKLRFNCNLTAVFDQLLFHILEERAKCRL